MVATFETKQEAINHADFKAQEKGNSHDYKVVDLAIRNADYIGSPNRYAVISGMDTRVIYTARGKI